MRMKEEAIVMFGKFIVDGREGGIGIGDFSPEDTLNLAKDDIEAEYDRLEEKFSDLQEAFYASKKYALLIVLQGMDCSGKDGTVKKALSGINPNGFYVEAFKAPTPVELGHDYLWRVHQRTPQKGGIAGFNRSHYEEGLVTPVPGLVDDETARRRFEEIRDFEKYLTANGTVVLKFFLHISKDFQREKLLERLETPDKNWKFSEADLNERKFWAEYQRCYGDVLAHTGTKYAPWHVVPANHRWFRDYLVLRAVVKALEKLPLEYPAIQGNAKALIEALRSEK